jgi:hypothetical protein
MANLHLSLSTCQIPKLMFLNVIDHVVGQAVLRRESKETVRVYLRSTTSGGSDLVL